jgi:hypothetical protein
MRREAMTLKLALSDLAAAALANGVSPGDIHELLAMEKELNEHTPSTGGRELYGSLLARLERYPGVAKAAGEVRRRIPR